MTTTPYTVAYPHPDVPSVRRINRFLLNSDVDGRMLVESLCDRYPDHRDDLKDATLWKAFELKFEVVDNKSRVPIYEWIKEREGNSEIKPYEVLEDRFPDGPRRGFVDIVVVTSEILEDVDYQGDVDGNLKHMKAREELSRTMTTTGSPSDSVKSFAAVKGAVDRPTGPRYGRPSDRFGPPTALFSRELALLRYDLEHLEAFTPHSTTADHTFDLIEDAANFFDDEGGREKALRPTLERLLVGESQWQTPIAGGSTKPDGVWLEEFFIYLIVEIKNEPGLGGDPFLQGLIAYSKIVAQEKYRPFVKQSNLPVVLLAIAGNRLVVSTAIFTDSIFADELVSIRLHFGPHASDNVLRVARVFMAINKCTERLRRLYRDLAAGASTTPLGKVLWPSPTIDPAETTEGIPELEFFSKVDRLRGMPINQTTIDENNKRHAIYLARMRTEGGASTVDVLVKFAVKYNATAHRLLADHDPPLAPALHSCKRVVGDMFMVVMEYIPNSKGASLYSVSLSPSALESVRQGVSQALDLLHGENLVFGDLRELNVLYLPGEGRALLVDFDGVGRDGEDRYSACLNHEVGLGVVRLQIMEKSHDEENLKKLMDRLSGRL